MPHKPRPVPQAATRTPPLPALWRRTQAFPGSLRGLPMHPAAWEPRTEPRREPGRPKARRLCASIWKASAHRPLPAGSFSPESAGKRHPPPSRAANPASLPPSSSATRFPRGRGGGFSPFPPVPRPPSPREKSGKRSRGPSAGSRAHPGRTHLRRALRLVPPALAGPSRPWLPPLPRLPHLRSPRETFSLAGNPRGPPVLPGGRRAKQAPANSGAGFALMFLH